MYIIFFFILILATTNVLAEPGYFGSQVENYQQTFFESLRYRTRSLERECASSYVYRAQNGPLMSSSTISTSTINQQVFREEDKIVVVYDEIYDYGGSRSHHEHGNTVYEFLEENTLKATTTSHTYVDSSNGEFKKETNIFEKISHFENNIERSVVSYKVNGVEREYNYARYTQLFDPFGTRFTTTVISTKPESMGSERTQYLSYQRTCIYKEVGIESYRDLYQQTLLGKWSTPESRNDVVNLDFKRDSTYSSNSEKIGTGFYEIKDGHLFLEDYESGKIRKFRLEFENYNTVEIEEIGNPDKYDQIKLKRAEK